MPPAPRYRRVLLKLSGEGLMGEREYGLDPKMVGMVAQEIKTVHEMGVQVCLVIGGGNIFRGVSAAASGMDRASGDYMGMLATVINSLAAAALRAAEMSVDAMLKGTQVDGVYSADPRKDKTAKRYDTLTYMDVLQQDLQVMDASAISLARENKIPIIVFDIHKSGSFADTMAGKGTHTIIKDEG